MNIERLLPLGSVVYLNEGITPLMIGIRQPIIQLEGEQCYFDYAAFSQITGITVEEIAYFNNEDISEVVAEGYVGKDEDRVLAALNEWREKNSSIPKGKVVDMLNKHSELNAEKEDNSLTFGF